ncbi:MAG: dihydrofolate reductase family protein [Phycisphaeraceae bacterium JB051]
MNRPKVSVFIATSLDGYIAREDGALDWLDAASQTVTPGEDCGYKAFIQSVDALVMGRKTYEKVLTFGDWPYGDKPVIVLSHQPIDFPDALLQSVSHSDLPPEQLCEALASRGLKRVYLDGGQTIQRFLAANLVDEMIITLIPTLLGNGISLFGELAKDIPLKLMSTQTFDFGFVQLCYHIQTHS